MTATASVFPSANRRATLRIRVDHTPTTLNDWGALGGVIGRLAGNYWAVPVIEGRLMLGTWQRICLVDTNVDNAQRHVRLSFLAG